MNPIEEIELDEPEDAGDDHDVPVELTVLNEVIQWNAAVADVCERCGGTEPCNADH